MKSDDSRVITIWFVAILSFIAGNCLDRIVNIYHNSTYLEPEDGEARVLNRHIRHYVWKDTIERLEIRKNEHGKEEWMVMSKNGKLEPAFWFDYSDPVEP